MMMTGNKGNNTATMLDDSWPDDGAGMCREKLAFHASEYNGATVVVIMVMEFLLMLVVIVVIKIVCA